MRIIVMTVFFALSVQAAMSSGEKRNPSQQEQTISSVKKALSSNDITGIPRLKVQGATFRAFNLFLPQFTIELKAGATPEKAQEIRAIIERDFAITGSISLIKAPENKAPTDDLLKQKGAEGVTRIKLILDKDRLSGELEHKNLLNGKTSRKYIARGQQELRNFAHLLAQSTFEEFVGPEDLFTMKIAAVKKKGHDSQIVLMDFDGGNQQVVSSGMWEKALPSFAPDRKSVLYTVVTKDGQGIIEQEIGSSKFEYRTKLAGLNMDPRVLPDNSGLLVTLSLGKSANIYHTNRQGKIIGPLTESIGYNLSPVISRNGKWMAFVSTRSGNPQVYEQELGGMIKKSDAKRVTMKGRYNQTPDFSRETGDPTMIAFTGRSELQEMDIFYVVRKNGTVYRVTQSQGRNQEARFASSSNRFLVFVSQRDWKEFDKMDLYIATLNGDHQHRLTTDGGYFSPAVW